MVWELTRSGSFRCHLSWFDRFASCLSLPIGMQLNFLSKQSQSIMQIVILEISFCSYLKYNIWTNELIWSVWDKLSFHSYLSWFWNLMSRDCEPIINASSTWSDKFTNIEGCHSNNIIIRIILFHAGKLYYITGWLNNQVFWEWEVPHWCLSTFVMDLGFKYFPVILKNNVRVHLPNRLCISEKFAFDNLNW